MVRAISRIALIALCTLLAVEGAAAATCTANQYVRSNVCTDCPTGYARAAGDDSTGADTACLMCAADYYVSAKGADASTPGTCSTCGSTLSTPAGADSTSTGTLFAAANKGCLSCKANYYLSTKGTDATTAGTCTQCPSKSYIASADATSTGTVSRCTSRECAANQYVNAKTCKDCPTGYQNDAGDDSTKADTECDKCAVGYWLAVKGSTATTAGTCTACDTGFTSAAAVDATSSGTVKTKFTGCLKTAAGYALKKKGKSTGGTSEDAEVLACDAGFTADSADATKDGTDGKTKLTGCLKTAPGYFLATIGKASGGTSEDAVSTACDAGFSSASVDATKDGTEKTKLTGCLLTAPGYFLATKGKSTGGTSEDAVSTACPTGKTSASVDATKDGTAKTAATGCLSVAANYYASALGADANTAGTVTACATGSTNAAGDVSTGGPGAVASSCDVPPKVISGAKCANTAYTMATAGCAACATNYRVSVKGADALTAGTCAACGAGSTNAAGDLSTSAGATSTCDGTSCEANKYVSSNVCTACAAGTTNAAGDDASGADTTCDATTCAANQKVTSNACVACAAGTTNAAGDNASGSDTTCDATTCAADHYVSSNVCTDCAAGSTNAAGDDASGADTACDIVSGASPLEVKLTSMISFLVIGFLALAM